MGFLDAIGTAISNVRNSTIFGSDWKQQADFLRGLNEAKSAQELAATQKAQFENQAAPLDLFSKLAPTLAEGDQPVQIPDFLRNAVGGANLQDIVGGIRQGEQAKESRTQGLFDTQTEHVKSADTLALTREQRLKLTAQNKADELAKKLPLQLQEILSRINQHNASAEHSRRAPATKPGKTPLARAIPQKEIDQAQEDAAAELEEKGQQPNPTAVSARAKEILGQTYGPDIMARTFGGSTSSTGGVGQLTPQAPAPASHDGISTSMLPPKSGFKIQTAKDPQTGKSLYKYVPIR